jgi:diguanylate cyclase (GGDEF)-like protein/PAS domain S-box-containing protein
MARLAKLSSSVNLINKPADSAARVPEISDSDELSSLAQSIKSMLISLDDQKKVLKESELRWKFAIEGAGDGVWDWNIQTGEVQYSMLWKSMLGYSDEDILPTEDEWIRLMDPDDLENVAMTMQDYLDGKNDSYVVEYRLRCKDNQYKWILARGEIVNFSEDGKPLRMLGTHTDISDRKVVEAELKIAATAFESQEGMFITDAENVILRVNHAFTDMTGYTSEEAVGKTPRLISSGRHDAAFYEEMWGSLTNQYAWKGEIWNRRKNCEIYPGHINITAVKDDKGNVTNYVASFTDITLRKAAENEIQNLAFYDPLTGLPNRRLLLDRLQQSTAHNARSQQGVAVLFLDLDYFKTVNDTLGHDVGDLLLRQVALRLESCVRDCDTVARLGGDEFVIILENLSEHVFEAASQTEEVGQKILAKLNMPYQLAGHEYHSTLSIGAVMINNRNQAPEESLKQADIAMYHAKKAGRNTLRFFDPEMQASINLHAQTKRELYEALEKQQFVLYYQAQVGNNGNFVGAEALLRWNHPTRGLVKAQEFISQAEESDLILHIGMWVLKTACAQLQSWQQNPATCDLELSVNISAKQLHQVDFFSQLEALVHQYAINPLKLKLELNESALFGDIANTIGMMHKLKKTGIRFSLDDFGAGNYFLQYLKQLPICQLKIDQSFVRDIVEDSNDEVVVKTIVAMADTLNLNVIAEGVETKEQQQLLVKSGCMNFQGYLFSKPIPIKDFQVLVGASRQEYYI